MLRAESQITDAFRSGAGMGWQEHHDDVFAGTEMFFRPGFVANLVPSWIPALDGVQAKLAAGARVADVGCGLGSPRSDVMTTHITTHITTNKATTRKAVD